jgi:hypothetical protein
MMAIFMLAASASAPVISAGDGEAQWRRFVKASLQSSRSPARGEGLRMRQLQGVVRGLGDDLGRRRGQVAGDPSGL